MEDFYIYKKDNSYYTKEKISAYNYVLKKLIEIQKDYNYYFDIKTTDLFNSFTIEPFTSLFKKQKILNYVHLWINDEEVNIFIYSGTNTEANYLRKIITKLKKGLRKKQYIAIKKEKFKNRLKKALINDLPTIDKTLLEVIKEKIDDTLEKTFKLFKENKKLEAIVIHTKKKKTYYSIIIHRSANISYTLKKHINPERDTIILV